jgi:hypothetical protein
MTMAMKNPPRRTTIRGQKHLLAYITPEEAQLLMDNGGSGEPGPMGIPSFPPGFGSERSGFGAERAGGAAGGKSGAAGPSGKDGDGPDNNKGMSPGEAQAKFGSGGAKYGGMTNSEIAAAAGALSTSASKAQQEEAQRIANLLPQAKSYIENVNALQNLNRQLEDLSRRERVQQDRLRSPLSLIPGVGLANYLGLQNVRNLAAAAIGAPPGLLGSFGFGERVSPDFGGLGVSDLVGLQSQAVTDDMGNIVGFRDEAGNVRYGKDPDAGFDGDGRETVAAEYNPNTGRQDQCPEGYVFDEDLQACRMGGGTPGFGTPVTGAGPYEAGDYARMGLLDVAPMGTGMFAERYGAGFGTPQDFSAANLAFRRGAATRPQYFQQAPDLTGYTLLA